MRSEEDVRVSVVVVTYNHEDTIGRTLDSILMQARDFKIEIIIGDDASTDDTEKICRKYAGKYPDIIRYIRNKTNKGVLKNYYDCLLVANGEYIADVAGDDFWIDKQKLKKQVEVLDNNPDVVLTCTDWMDYDENTHEYKSPWKTGVYPYKDWFSDQELQLKLLSHIAPNAVHLCTALYRKDAFLELYIRNPFPFQNREFVVEDLQLTVLMSTLGEIRFVDYPSLAYSVNDKSLTGTKNFTKLFDLYFGSMKLTRYLADAVGIEQFKLNSVYSNMIHYISMQAFHSEDKERLKKVKSLVKEWNVPLDWKTRIIFIASESPLIWNSMLKLLNIRN